MHLYRFFKKRTVIVSKSGSSKNQLLYTDLIFNKISVWHSVRGSCIGYRRSINDPRYTIKGHPHQLLFILQRKKHVQNLFQYRLALPA
jgi:hypothetical protein